MWNTDAGPPLDLKNAMDSAATDASDLSALLQKQREAHRREPCPDWATRAARLRTLRAMLLDNREPICKAIGADFGCRPVEETQLLELFPSLTAIRHALRHGKRWMRPRHGFAGLWFLPARTTLMAQPVGVVGVIVPWNYPLFLAVGPVIDALAAGNRVMVKMSEYTPTFSALFAELCARHFPDGAVTVVNGGPDVAQAFSALPFDHLLFTGSTAVGRLVMRAAADNLTPVTLELGGKSPAIIGPGADFEHAVERIIYGKCVNAGQTCIAPDYVLLPRDREQAFIDTARKVFARLYPDFADGSSYASVITDRQYERLATTRDDAIAHGAIAHPLTTTTSDVVRRMAPTLFTNVDPGSRLMREELFGPLLPLVPYATLDEAFAFVDARPHPLSLYLFERSKAVQRRVLRRQLAGGVCVNDTLYHIVQHSLPFGGVGDSGMGAYHGKFGFDAFSKLKPVFRQARFNGVGLLNPPYGKRFQHMLKLLTRH
ncbi:MAG TPA: coniferyl aldehyde dehydrogenase [Rhodanobacteraceae bacterium]|nr:coniferyl aldehyde dehydrogenase [Rhodanobacteraceae bacterium]